MRTILDKTAALGHPRPMALTPVHRKILGRLAVFTGLMTAGVVTTALGESLGWAVALVWGLGAGLAAAGVFVLWFLWKESRPQGDE
jgi:hypothetical protein